MLSCKHNKMIFFSIYIFINKHVKCVVRECKKYISISTTKMFFLHGVFCLKLWIVGRVFCGFPIRGRVFCTFPIYICIG